MTHEHIVHESHLRSLLKGFTARIIEIAFDTVVLSIAGLHPFESVGIAILMETVCYCLGYFNERIWNRVQWGRKVVEKICQKR
jgi:uncharacterized membrane protein